MQTHYDYIILGAGLSGLTTALRMCRDSFFNSKKIVIVDQDLHKGNDRTWCFWETEPDLYEEVIAYQWPKVLVQGSDMNQMIDIAPYSYKKVESADLYAFAKAQLSQHSNIAFIEGKVLDITENKQNVTVTLGANTITADCLLNSIYTPDLLTKQNQKVVLQQHFIGWFIKTKEPVFNPEVATYMDFKIPQKGNCRFMYVLPTSPNEALLEYTLFSEKLLPKSDYEEAIKDYLKTLRVTQYTIRAKEQGSIPMTTYDFTQHNSQRILYIGTAGGWTKASTGYTFKHTVKKSKKLVDFLKSGKPFTSYTLKNRWTFYDGVLLKVLAKHNDRGAEIFTRMFKKGKAAHIFRFLDEESSFWDELQVIWSAPKMPFIIAAIKIIFRQ